MVKELKNKPLVEAILEVKWVLQGTKPGPQIDPHYKLFLGRLFDRLLTDYPEHEQLPTANMPDELAGHVVQHRFRKALNEWPLVQIGPGIFTVNSTADYTWKDFRPRALSAIEKLFEAYPKLGDLKISNIILRYIDAVEFDYNSENAFEFLREKLKIDISLPDNLFEDTSVKKRPKSLTWHSSFECQNPKGRMNIRVANGQRNNRPAIVWETIVETVGSDLPKMPSDFEEWLDSAHSVTDDWFFKLIEGELERRFSGE